MYSFGAICHGNFKKPQLHKKIMTTLCDLEHLLSPSSKLSKGPFQSLKSNGNNYRLFPSSNLNQSFSKASRNCHQYIFMSNSTVIEMVPLLFSFIFSNTIAFFCQIIQRRNETSPEKGQFFSPFNSNENKIHISNEEKKNQIQSEAKLSTEDRPTNVVNQS